MEHAFFFYHVILYKNILLYSVIFQANFIKFVSFLFKDESHSLKSDKTARTKIALSLAMQSSQCILLSGTPALSRPIELYTQIKAVTRNNFMNP